MKFKTWILSQKTLPCSLLQGELNWQSNWEKFIDKCHGICKHVCWVALLEPLSYKEIPVIQDWYILSFFAIAWRRHLPFYENLFVSQVLHSFKISRYSQISPCLHNIEVQWEAQRAKQFVACTFQFMYWDQTFFPGKLYTYIACIFRKEVNLRDCLHWFVQTASWDLAKKGIICNGRHRGAKSLFLETCVSYEK